MFIGKLVANGFLREEAGDGGANGGGGPVSLMAGAGDNAGGDGAGNGDGDGGEGAAATVVEMAEAVRPERAPCCGMIWGMRRR